ncbi:MAG: acyltransferase [Tessaracoccus sp.]|uniref:acyltransferase family protein n=1 Tax=Tessaracoccus sp. TaxID=1971211 RepID=UPI001EB22E98|nr:acyltransferase family protein [Tessaracoccus sp.]MBK7819549.1 acyltransferase [Tessaracoccus sp.]
MTYIPSLDGLRTVAVGLVIAFHLSVPRMGLGFAGVDVFFVLSGYLITAGLLRDVERDGRPRFASFWQRRFKRLLPAAALALLVVLAYATFMLPLHRRAAASWDVFWTALYVGNWHFLESTSYFASDGTPSLLLHMWSLAVEEQFYFVWPLLIGATAMLARGRLPLVKINEPDRTVAWLGVLAGALIAASAVALAALYDPAAPDRAYMGTDAKAFEPLLGALLAIVLSRGRAREWCARHARMLTAVGVVGAVAVLPFLAGPSPFYFQGGALGLSLAVAVLIAGLLAGPGTAVARVLGWAPVAYLGKISYGLYIWHWPWSVWLGVAHREEFRPGAAAVALAATVACAVVSYHLVEQPIRRGRLSPWLTPRRVLGGAVAITLVVVGWSTALRLAPLTDGRPAILIIGDSVPYRLMDSFDAAARGDGFVVDGAARGGCPPMPIELQEYLKPDHEGKGDCRVMEDIQDERLRVVRPEIVFWWSRYEIHQRWVDGRVVGPEEDAFWVAQERDLRATIDRLTATGARLVIAQTERPGLGMSTRCDKDSCHPLYDLMMNHDEYRRRWNDLVERLAEEDGRVRTFRMDPLLCADPEPAEPQSPSSCDDLVADAGEDTAEGVLLRPDGSHVDADRFGEDVARRILREVLRVG